MNVFVLIMLAVSSSVIASYNIILVNKQVNTYIDVSSQIAYVSRKIVVENVINAPVKTYTLIIDWFWLNNLSFIEAVDGQGTYLKVVRNQTTNSQLRYEIYFDDALYPATQETLSISTVFIDVFQNQPKKIKQYETHFVLFMFNVYFYSKYFTEIQTTVLDTGANKVSYVNGAKFKITNDTDSKYGLQYGPYHNIVAKTQFISSVHYKNTSPFLIVEQLKRQIQISHWGFVTIRDHISLLHNGPKLEGPFERPYKEAKPDATRIDFFVSTLPRHAFDIYLKDEIGIVSSFNVDYSETKVDVEIKPRFVLYGGWKTNYELSYSLPIEYYLTHYDDMFSLALPLVDKVLPNMVVNEAEISVILPEGASFLDVDPYVDLENNTNSRYCYFFDTICREIVLFKKHNLFHHHCSTTVRFTYTFSQYLLLTKPITLASFVYVTLLLVAGLSRLSTKVPEETREKSCKPGKPVGFPRQSKSEQAISKPQTKPVNNRPKKHSSRK